MFCFLAHTSRSIGEIKVDEPIGITNNTNVTTNTTNTTTDVPTKQVPVDVFRKSIQYGTGAVLGVVLIGIVAWMFQLGDEKDSLIYSKFLSNRKKNN